MKYIGFGSWHTHVLLKNVQVSLPIVSDETLAKRYSPSNAINWYNNETLRYGFLMLYYQLLDLFL